MPEPLSHADYLAPLPPGQLELLSHLRAQVHRIQPDAEECISYSLPAFKTTKPFAGYSDSKAHCSFFPCSGTTLATLKDDLPAFKWSPGGVQFTAAKPLPEVLIRKIIAVRPTEIEAIGK